LSRASLIKSLSKLVAAGRFIDATAGTNEDSFVTAVIGRFIDAAAGTDKDAFDTEASSRERLEVARLLVL
jgi:hypothetical protein